MISELAKSLSGSLHQNCPKAVNWLRPEGIARFADLKCTFLFAKGLNQTKVLKRRPRSFQGEMNKIRKNPNLSSLLDNFFDETS